MLNSKKDRDRKERIDLLEKNLAADTNKKKETFAGFARKVIMERTPARLR